MDEIRLTTIDNPYDPFEQFTEWYMWDTMAGYNTCGYLARIANISDLLTDEENNMLVKRAIEEILNNDVRKIYKTVIRKPIVA